jgi:hypothetical protein
MKKMIILAIALILTSVIVTSASLVNRTNYKNVIMPYSEKPQEVASPHDRIKESQIKVYKDRVIIEIKDAQWAGFIDTNSMDPVIDKEANAIQVVPESYHDVHVGDIISYESEYGEGIYIHRVIKVGFDPEGWYCIAKGDNNPTEDPGKIRFSQIKKVVIAIIY